MTPPPNAPALTLEVAAHPLLEPAAFVVALPSPLGAMAVPPEVKALADGADGRFPAPTDTLRSAVRDLLRHGGYKPTGRGKPASEYLARAAGEPGGVRSINLLVDACNAVSLRTGLPISVVDLARTEGRLRIAVAPPDTSYVFNASGQVIDVGGLLGLEDEQGPTANAVKDAQRTKTDEATRAALVVVWGTVAAPGLATRAAAAYRELLELAGARTDDVALAPDATKGP